MDDPRPFDDAAHDEPPGSGATPGARDEDAITALQRGRAVQLRMLFAAVMLLIFVVPLLVVPVGWLLGLIGVI
jgi:hypothetical protein